MSFKQLIENDLELDLSNYDTDFQKGLNRNEK